MNDKVLELILELVKNKETKEETKDSGIKIVILQRGWVVIGRFSEVGEYCYLTDAYVIRRWGTSEGLGELALKGKQTETKLEKTGTVKFHKLTSVALIDATHESWNNILK